MSQDVAENLKQFKAKIPEQVTLVAVSKTKPKQDIEAAYQTGHKIFGENRIQEMTDKWEELPRDIQWHMIGHVQGNKIKYMAPYVSMVHGMDKPKRFKELNKEARKNERKIDCLLQIHIAQEESKFGFSYREAEDFLNEDLAAKYPHVRLRGLMAMATNTDDEDKVRKEFRQLKSFFDRMRDQAHLGAHFDLLSMGMSGDYKIALEEGSNMIRIGSRLFGARD